MILSNHFITEKMNIVVVSDNYPSDRIPNKGAFVYNLIQALSHHHKITVIAPYKVNELMRSRTGKGYGKENCVVYRPVYPSFSNKNVLGFNTKIISRYFAHRATYRALKKLPQKPDLIYAHFLSNALSCLRYVAEYNIPLVVASGEAFYAGLILRKSDSLDALNNLTRHFICVSDSNRKALVEMGLDENKMSIVPNAVDTSLFKPLPKDECREKLGIPKDKFVVGFVGYFIHRKGPNRIIEAIKQLSDKDVRLVCIGGTEELDPNDFTTTVPPIPNYQLAEYYNAFDIFVLPTLSEGHCNAIEEAKACGLPVVSSLGTSVEAQLNDSIGILVDPLNINEIASAIGKLKAEPALRASMRENLLANQGAYSLEKRAAVISALLTEVVNNR